MHDPYQHYNTKTLCIPCNINSSFCRIISLEFFQLKSDSMASVYSGAGEGRYGTVTVRGQVEFGLQYNYKAGALEIQIRQCRDLAPVDAKRNRSDPYVKVYLLPDKSKSGKRKTKVKKHTLNPVFDECLKFHISLNGLETRTLWLTVWHSDMFGRNDFLGEVMMALENKVFDDPTPKWYNLQERVSVDWFYGQGSVICSALESAGVNYGRRSYFWSAQEMLSLWDVVNRKRYKVVYIANESCVF